MRKKASNWRSARLPALSHHRIETNLRSRYTLWLHGWILGASTLAVMVLVAWLLRHWIGGGSLALRYAVSLTVGYGVYLLMLRWWAARLLQDKTDDDIDPLDAADAAVDALECMPDAPSDGDTADAASGLAAKSLEAVTEADEAAVVLVPVMVIFAVGLILLSGMGAAAFLFFGTEALMAVAVELAFAYTAARTVMATENAGWLQAAVALTYKPMLGALLCAVALGGAIDYWMPGIQTLPQVLRWLKMALL